MCYTHTGNHIKHFACLIVYAVGIVANWNWIYQSCFFCLLVNYFLSIKNKRDEKTTSWGCNRSLFLFLVTQQHVSVSLHSITQIWLAHHTTVMYATRWLNPVKFVTHGFFTNQSNIVPCKCKSNFSLYPPPFSARTIRIILFCLWWSVCLLDCVPSHW